MILIVVMIVIVVISDDSSDDSDSEVRRVSCYQGSVVIQSNGVIEYHERIPIVVVTQSSRS